MTPLFRLPFGRAFVFFLITFAAEGQPTLIKQITDAASNLFAAGDFVYYTSKDSLFRTDGTEAGTILLRDGMNFGYTPRFTEYKELLIFTVFSASGPMGEIWEIWPDRSQRKKTPSMLRYTLTLHRIILGYTPSHHEKSEYNSW